MRARRCTTYRSRSTAPGTRRTSSAPSSFSRSCGTSTRTPGCGGTPKRSLPGWTASLHGGAMPLRPSATRRGPTPPAAPRTVGCGRRESHGNPGLLGSRGRPAPAGRRGATTKTTSGPRPCRASSTWTPSAPCRSSRRCWRGATRGPCACGARLCGSYRRNAAQRRRRFCSTPCAPTPIRKCASRPCSGCRRCQARRRSPRSIQSCAIRRPIPASWTRRSSPCPSTGARAREGSCAPSRSGVTCRASCAGTPSSGWGRIARPITRNSSKISTRSWRTTT